MTAAEASERVELAKHCSSRNWSKAIRVLDSLLAKQCSILDIWWFVIINWRRLSSLSLVPFKLIYSKVSSPVPQSIDSSYSSLNHGVELVILPSELKWTAYAFQRELENAIDDFTKAIQSNPAAGEAWKRRGQARAALGEFAEAVEDLTRALELEPKPKSPDILHERCIIKDFTAGVNDLSICLKQEKDNKSAYTYLGLSFASLGEYIKAEEAHLKSIQLDSNYLEAWLHLAQFYQELADYSKALECIDQALQVDNKQAKKDKLKNSQKKTEEVKPESCDVEGADKGLKRRDCEDGNEVEEKEEASSKAKKPKVVLRLLQDERLIKKKKLRNQKMLVAVSQLRNILGLGTREAEAISVDFTSKAYRKRLAIHEVFPSQSSDNNLLFFRNLQAEASTICSDGEPSDDNVAALLRVRVMLCIPQQTIEAANAEICGSIFEKRSNFFWSEMVTNAETRKSVRKAAHGLLRLSERLPCLLLARLSVGFSQTIYQTSKSGREPQRVSKGAQEDDCLESLRKTRPDKELAEKMGKPGQTEITLKNDLPERDRIDLYKTILALLSNRREIVNIHVGLAEQEFRQQAAVILADGQLTKARVEQLDELQKQEQVGLPQPLTEKVIKNITTTKMANAKETAVNQGRQNIKQIRESSRRQTIQY
ncbi:hypothetical protein F2Q68_00030053 [Brassica cretica]|uniref:Uncharacterized protein n=1 Tax=Brassica cretica TaxID=69181 RepID=A0A8S9G8G3_BRACR|nr:hypothetical protein F2Q68_00030053 [Brassica cretica]